MYMFNYLKKYKRICLCMDHFFIIQLELKPR